jgi:hypothetical protein
MDIDVFRNELLQEHNLARAYYGNVQQLVLDDNINREAQIHAEHLARYESSLVHIKKSHLGKLYSF